ncbi:hypothetical protein [Bradyrhizobium diazoefficiens]|uniref:hypothetical protein n=1 Tax=Bradyrhizobium diazoefficiens TaxID=1355477 RepID=UPI00272C6104|nr:hypothetical protein [Bradyrhizobium diazoefficiens]WLA68021.1 hypothetical protein QNN01_15910 [Bradyrhizobium diazoefficiens]
MAMAYAGTASDRHPNTDTLLLIILGAAEVIAFYIHVHFNVAPFYPQAFDQLSYYLETYDLADKIRAYGMAELPKALFESGNATGTTFALQGSLISLIGGVSRTTFLTINVIYLLAAQFIVFLTVRSLSSSAFGWTALALLTSASTLFNGAGGLYDYRIDFTAMCLYGICISLILWSRVFLDCRKAAIAALVCILLVYARFFTAIYIAGVLAFLLAIQIAQWMQATSPEHDLARQRARNIFWCGCLIALVCIPRLYVSRDAIYNYYMIGHVLGEEKFIRASELGIHGLLAHLLYYPRSVIGSHIGVLTWIIAALLAILSFRQIPISATKAFQRLHSYRLEFTTLFVATLVPLALLTANLSKSQVVGGIVTIPIVLIMILIGIALWPRGTSIRIAGRIFDVAVLAVSAGLIVFFLRASPWPNVQKRADLDRFSLMGTEIARYAADRNLTKISLSVDRVSDFINVGIPRLFSIERFHRNLMVEGLFGHGQYGIFATPREDALRLYANSDVIVMTDPNKDRAHPYPINTKIREYWPELWQWANQNRRLIFSTTIDGVPYYLFVR